jgi:hypothetical protein
MTEQLLNAAANTGLLRIAVLFLVLAALVVGAAYLRWRLMHSPSLTQLTCPTCGNLIERVPRRPLDRLINWYVPVMRYQCSTRDCQWEGLRILTADSSRPQESAPGNSVLGIILLVSLALVAGQQLWMALDRSWSAGALEGRTSALITVGAFLVPAALIAAVAYIRWRLLHTSSLAKRTCSKCGGSLERIARRQRDHLVSWYVPVKRFACEAPGCDWQGLRIAAVGSPSNEEATSRNRVLMIALFVLLLLAAGLQLPSLLNRSANGGSGTTGTRPATSSGTTRQPGDAVNR